jgi:outer membrane protein TolC
MGTSSHDEVAARAYELVEERGRTHVHDLDDWLQAENELLESRQEHLGL